MWGSQAWNQWALQPAMFNDVPHEQIDWAELAKQWIQMQQAQPSDSIPLAPPPPLPPPPPQVVPPPVTIPPPPGHVPLIPEEFPEGNVAPLLLKAPVVPPAIIPEPFHSERPFENETAPAPFVPKTTDNNFWNKSQWEASAANDVDERLWTAPTVEPAAPLLAGKETFDYGHMHDNAPLAMQSIDYNHMSDFSYNQASCVYPTPAPTTPAPVPEAHYDQYWSQVNAAPTISPIFLKKERSATNLQVEEETTQIDAAKRKQLPAWIRDGLEKMEQERLKRLEKERAAKENAEKMAKIDSLKNELETKDGSSIIPVSVKSKFDSDSEADENGVAEKMVQKISPTLKRTPSPVEDTRSEEEKKLELMLKVRRTLTEILLSVTNSEMIEIAQEVYGKAMSKAPARQLASSTSLSSVASGLRGLASYGTESEASDPEEEDASDSEEELFRKIKEKKRLFAQKEKKIIADLEKKEHEEKNEPEKINNDKIIEKKFVKELHEPEKLENVSEYNSGDKNSLNVSLQPDGQIPSGLPAKSSTKSEVELENKTNEKKLETIKPVLNNQKILKEESDSSDSEESSSSDSSSESGEKRKKKSRKEMKKGKLDSRKTSKKDKNSSKHSSRHKRSRSRDSGSSDKHRRDKSRDRKGSSSKKGKKYKRSDSSSSSSSSLHRKKRSRYESSHGHRERRSHSYDARERKRRRSISPRSHQKKKGIGTRNKAHLQGIHLGFQGNTGQVGLLVQKVKALVRNRRNTGIIDQLLRGIRFHKDSPGAYKGQDVYIFFLFCISILSVYYV
ncbi:uncharacterized protein NPIL_703901 [Nephila pilipes]|uniref:Arginine/serine-rich protein PNISR n=1 Tax=Nephila pilipes TaxID=299642 RepID=A0A8X6M991_NEPPI|nr:uncharacterized protein NPIL_703901 [Nephila pilipes]